MKRLDGSCHRRVAVAWLAAALILTPGRSVAAQELPFHRDYPGTGPYQCAELPQPPAASPSALAQAAELASTSDQAVILGDLPRAAALLSRGVELDPASAPLAYRRARVFEDLGQVRDAVGEYCRALSLVPGGEREEWRARLQALVTAEVSSLPPEAITTFQAGLVEAESGRMADARTSFGRAADQAPEWASAEYNRGVTLARLGYPAEAAASLLRYLELEPDAADALTVARRIGQLQNTTPPRRQSGVMAAALGTVVPGMGQFYTGRPLGGFTVLLLAGGAAAAGYFIEEVDVRCLGPVPAGESCPESEVVSTRTDRPYLYYGLGAAAGLGIVAAVEAFFEARRSDRPRDVPTAPTGSPDEVSSAFALDGPSVSARRGRVDVSVVSVRFR